jgi:predicted nucleic acid-binding protein
LIPPVVPDASVILKWVLPPANEAYVEQALSLRSDIALNDLVVAVPPLWYYEVGNTLARRFPDSAARHLRELRNFVLPEAAPNTAWESTALRLTAEYGVTFYDASYHALAISLKGVFVTGDDRYLARAGLAGNLMHLKDWPLS